MIALVVLVLAGLAFLVVVGGALVVASDTFDAVSYRLMRAWGWLRSRPRR